MAVTAGFLGLVWLREVFFFHYRDAQHRQWPLAGQATGSRYRGDSSPAVPPEVVASNPLQRVGCARHTRPTQLAGQRRAGATGELTGKLPAISAPHQLPERLSPLGREVLPAATSGGAVIDSARHPVPSSIPSMSSRPSPPSPFDSVKVPVCSVSNLNRWLET